MAEAQTLPPAPDAPPVFLNAATVRAHAKEASTQMEPGAQEKNLGPMMRMLSMGNTPPYGAIDTPEGTPPPESAPPSFEEGSVLQDTLNHCAMFALGQAGTLTRDGSASDGSVFVSTHSTPTKPKPFAAQRQGSMGLPPSHSHLATMDVSEMMQQMDLGGSPPTPQLQPVAIAQHSSFGDFASLSPDFTPRCSGSMVSTGTCSSSNLTAMAAAASAQMLPAQVAALLQQQQQQQAEWTGSEAVQIKNNWQHHDLSRSHSLQQVQQEQHQQEQAAAFSVLSPPASSVGPASYAPSPAPSLDGNYQAILALQAQLHNGQMHNGHHSNFNLTGQLSQPATSLNLQQQAAWAAAAVALSAPPSQPATPFGSLPAQFGMPAALSSQPAQAALLEALLLKHRQQQALKQQQALAQQQAAVRCQSLFPDGSTAQQFAQQYGDASNLWHLARSSEPVVIEEPEPPECLVGLEGRYQPYCQQIISDSLNTVTTAALTSIKLLQMNDSPEMLRMSGRRYYCSLKEVSKIVPTARCLIVAPDVCVSPTAHINPVRTLQRILRDAQSYSVPIIFALSRKGIGQVFGRDKMMSIVAVMQLEGLENNFHVMMDEAWKGRQLYWQHRGPGHRR